MKFFSAYPSASRGLALIEVLVASFVLGVSTIAVTGLIVLGTRSSLESERQATALAHMNGVAETIRGMRYDDVGYLDATAGEANGTLHRSEAVTVNGLPYTVTLAISLLDDPANGTLPGGALSEATADYKQVGIKVSWQENGGTSRDVSIVIDVSPVAAGGGGGGGGGGQPCAPGALNACSNPVSTDPSACVPKTITCPANGICPIASPTPTCPPGAAFCPQCYVDANCAAGQVCNTSSGTCVAQAGACRSNSDCSNGNVCDNGTCTTSCVTAGCSSGEVCNTTSGTCSPSCVANACLCQNGYSCDAATGTCSAGSVSTPIPSSSPGPSVSATPTSSPSTTPTTLPTATPTPLLPTPTPTCVPGSPGCAPTPTPTANPGHPCTSSAQCNGGLVCIAGSCQGSWCPTPGVGLDCTKLPAPIDPGCLCGEDGRSVVTGYIPIQSSPDPMCTIQVVQACQPVSSYVSCGVNLCPTLTPTPRPPTPTPPPPPPGGGNGASCTTSSDCQAGLQCFYNNGGSPQMVCKTPICNHNNSCEMGEGYYRPYGLGNGALLPIWCVYDCGTQLGGNCNGAVSSGCRDDLYCMDSIMCVDGGDSRCKFNGGPFACVKSSSR